MPKQLELTQLWLGSWVDWSYSFTYMLEAILNLQLHKDPKVSLLMVLRQRAIDYKGNFKDRWEFIPDDLEGPRDRTQC